MSGKDKKPKKETKKKGVSMEQQIKDLNLLLMYLTGWEEDSQREPGQKIYRSWKGYLFETLNELEDDSLIRQFRNAKSVLLTEEGVERAKELESKFLK